MPGIFSKEAEAKARRRECRRDTLNLNLRDRPHCPINHPIQITEKARVAGHDRESARMNHAHLHGHLHPVPPLR